LLWAREAAEMVEEVLEASCKVGASPQYLSTLKAEARRWVARSAANQFVWTRIRGARLSECVRWIFECRLHFGLTWPVVSRVGAAVLVPPALLRRALLKSAARMAASRGGGETVVAH
jgi:hypothetical protein